MTSPAIVSTSAPELSAVEFQRIADVTKRVAGINLQRGKEGLVRARLARRLRALGLDSYGAYLEQVERDGTRAELKEMIDALTTNKTSFFRESQHFTFLRERVLPDCLAAGQAPRVWSAGCSTGEEPYTLGIVVHEAMPATVAAASRILATDISARVLDRARAAQYPADIVAELPRDLLRRHFVPASGGESWQVAEPVRRLVRFARLNLMGEWPMRGPFDAIFCRNVMIYFDKATQGRLVERFGSLLAPGGYLFVGHSESLTGLAHGFRYVQPAVYQKAEA